MRLRQTWLSLALVAILACCATSPSTHFYLLTAGPSRPPALSAYHGPHVRVLAVQIPAALDRPELVDALDAHEVRLREFDHWAAPLTSLVGQALTQELILRLGPGRLLAPKRTATPRRRT